MNLTPGDSGFKGTMDIPVQGLAGGQLDDLVVSGTELSFTLKPPGAPEQAWAKFAFKVSEDGQTAEGELTQSGQRLPVSMTLLRAGEEAEVGPNRPQTPKPPFPYEAREVTYRNEGAGVTLAGTLTLPAGPGPHPAVILITGSGQQDRDETLFAHKPFLVIADHLTRAGIAVLRVDDRGIGGSSGPVESATSDDFAGDVLSGVAFLESVPEVDRGRIGLIGHSEGGLIAPLAAVSAGDRVDFIVLLAGPGLPGREILLAQSTLIMRDAGVDEATIQKQTGQAAGIYTLLERGASDEEVKEEVRRIVVDQIADAMARGGQDAVQAEAVNAQLDTVINQQAAQLSSPWFRRFVVYDPRPTLEKVRCPVLALNGEFDRQVPPEENLAAIRKALEAGGNHGGTEVMLPGLNHLFQNCDASNAMAYESIEETMSPAALDAMTSWIRRQTGLDH